MVKIGKEGGSQGFVTIDVKDYQNLKGVEDKLCDVILCLDSTLDTLETFVETEQRLRSHAHETKLSPATKDKDFNTMLHTLKEKQREVVYTRKKAEALLAKAQNTRALVSHTQEAVAVP